MRYLYTAFFLCFATSVSVASDFKSWQSNHFGHVAVSVNDNFRIATLCTVSGGAVQSYLDDIELLLPPIVGSEFVKSLKRVIPNDGEALCGLKHYRGGNVLSLPAKTNGFKVDIKTYKDGEHIGGGSPSRACRKRIVNVFSFCYELIELESSNDKKATGVSMCIETENPDSGDIFSIISYSGDVPSVISDQTNDFSKNMKNTKCKERNY